MKTIKGHWDSLLVHEIFEKIPFYVGVRHLLFQGHVDMILLQRRDSKDRKSDLGEGFLNKCLNAFIVRNLLVKIIGWEGKDLCSTVIEQNC